MKQLHEGLDYRLYKIYIWGGLALVVVYTFVSILVFDTLSLPGPQVFLRLFLPSMLYFAGILLYWWWVFLFKGNRDLTELRQEQVQGVPAIKALKSWNTLHQAMAIHGGNVEEYIRNAKRANRPILAWYGIINLLAVWIYARWESSIPARMLGGSGLPGSLWGLLCCLWRLPSWRVGAPGARGMPIWPPWVWL